MPVLVWAELPLTPLPVSKRSWPLETKKRKPSSSKVIGLLAAIVLMPEAAASGLIQAEIVKVSPRFVAAKST